ncbi:hypothetical protein [Sinomicrobium sp.]
MKSLKFILLMLLLAAFVTSCGVIHRGNGHRIHTNGKGEIPPGQMKKMTGDKSAKHYAPGQRKKRGY